MHHNIKHKELIVIVKKIKKYILDFMPKIIIILSSVLLFVLTIGSILFSSFSKNNLFYDSINIMNIVLVLLITVLLLLYIYIGLNFFKKYKVKLKSVQKWSLIVIAFILGVVLLIYSQVPLAYDQNALFTWPFSFDYWSRFDYMIPMGLFGGVLIKLFGTTGGVLAFRIINALLMLLAFWSLGKITHKFFKNSDITKVYYLIAPLCVQFIFNVGWAYGNVPSISIMIFAFYLTIIFFETKKWQYGLLVVLLSFLALAFKLQAQVFMIAIIIVALINSVKIKKSMSMVVFAFSLMGIMLITLPFFRFIANSMQDEYTMRPFVASINIAQGIDAYTTQDKIAYNNLSIDNNLNLTPTRDLIGQWSYIIDGHTMTGLRDNVKAKEMSETRIKFRIDEFINNPKEASRFFLRKSLYGWATPDFESITTWGVGEYYGGAYANESIKPLAFTILQPGHKTYKRLLTVTDGYESLIYLSSLVGAMYVFRRKIFKEQPLILVIPLILLGQFALSLVTESGGRFNFYAFIILLPYSAVGIYWIIHKFEELRKKILSSKKV